MLSAVFILILPGTLSLDIVNSHISDDQFDFLSQKALEIHKPPFAVHLDRSYFSVNAQLRSCDVGFI